MASDGLDVAGARGHPAGAQHEVGGGRADVDDGRALIGAHAIDAVAAHAARQVELLAGLDQLRVVEIDLGDGTVGIVGRLGRAGERAGTEDGEDDRDQCPAHPHRSGHWIR